MRADIQSMIWERWPRAASHIYTFLKHKFGTVPHYRTVLRFIRRYEREHREALLYRFKPKEWRHEMMPSLGDAAASAQAPNDVWEADTTPADLICADGRRRKIIALVDVYSRRAICRLVEREDAAAVVATLRAAILTWGLPKVLKMDNGMVYHKSKHVLRVCAELGIETPRLPVRAPETKPHVERFFRTLSEGLFAELTGYTGNCLANRPEVVIPNLQPEQLQALIDRWVEAVHHETVHSMTGQRPRERAQVLGQVIRRVDERELDLLLMREEERVVRQAVVTYQGHRYYHPALVNGERVTLKIDEADAGRVIVFSRGRFLCVAENPVAKGLSVEEIVQAKRCHLRAIKQKVTAQLELAKPGPVDGRIRELLRAREEAQPLSLPQRAEVIRLDRYAEAARTAEPEKEPQTSEDDREGLLFESEADRYKWLIERRVRGEALSEADLTFMRGFETTDLYAELSSYYSTWEAFLRGRTVRDTA
jgi:transposase InsO family protein